MTDYLDILTSYDETKDVPPSPFEIFSSWYHAACTAEPADPNATCLSTVTTENRPNSRIVLIKHHDENGFVFYTNTHSVKGEEIAAKPFASLNFYWKSLKRQIRISGMVEKVDDITADAYFSTRPRASQIGAWASLQSQHLASRQDFEDRIEKFSIQFKNEKENIPRPPHWSGYRVIPDYFEFWHAEEHRLHYRLTYEKKGDKWETKMLYP